MSNNTMSIEKDMSTSSNVRYQQMLQINDKNKKNTIRKFPNEVNAVHVRPDMSFRDQTMTNKYMEPLKIEGGTIRNESLCPANNAKITALDMERLETKTGVFSEPEHEFTEISWENDSIFEPLRRDSIFIPMSTLDYEGSINLLIPDDPTLFYYDYTNNRRDDLRRSFLIRDCEFSPYARLGVFNFSPIFQDTDLKTEWRTFGLKEKYKQAYEIQRSIFQYTAIMFKIWFPNDCTSELETELYNYGFTKRIAEIFNLKMKQGAYTVEHDQSFLKLVMNSNHLHWYKSPYTTRYDKLKFCSTYPTLLGIDFTEENKNDKDKNLERLINDEESIESDKIFYYVDYKVNGKSINLTINNISTTLYNSLLKKDVNTILSAQKMKYLVYLWRFQNSLCLYLENFVEAYEESLKNVNGDITKALNLERGLDNNNVTYDSNNMDNGQMKDFDEIKESINKDIPYDLSMENVLSPIRRYLSNLQKLKSTYMNIVEAALGARYFSNPDNRFSSTSIIDHSFVSFKPAFKNFLAIRYVGGPILDQKNVVVERYKENEYGQLVENSASIDTISGKSIVFRYGIFTIFLARANKISDRSAAIAKDESPMNKSDIIFDHVIVTWENNYIEFSSTSEIGDFWYEAYHTKGQGNVKGIERDSSCVMIRFRPEMNIKYDYSTNQKLNNVDNIHKLFSSCFYILDIYFTDDPIHITRPEVNQEKNIITIDAENQMRLVYGLSMRQITDDENTRYKYSYILKKGTITDNSGKRIGYDRARYKGGNIFADVSEKHKKYANTQILNIIRNEEKDQEIVQDDEWRTLIGNPGTNNIGKDDTKVMVEEKEPENNENQEQNKE